jgi:tetratricopeptide (TPR) repeat protein
LKTIKLKYISFTIILVFVAACSTKKNKLINRQFQALNTKYNVLYHGNIALEKGIVDLKSQYKDNFWEILPIERIQVASENILPGEKNKNANFDRAEEKATKAIQKRSMNIDGKEKNPQIDEAHILLGKARYYEQRFIPALEAFNYILYKYPESDKIYEAKIWREKTNMRLDNDAIAVKNLRKLLKEIKFKDQVFADANATLCQAFLNLDKKDSAVAKIKIAEKFTKNNEEKARYRFILGQLYDDLNYKDSAFVAYQSVIDMKRKSPKRYFIQSQGKQAKQFDFAKGDTIAFLKNYKKLFEDRENRPYLDHLNHQMALYYDTKKNSKRAIVFYNKSLRAKSEDQYLFASNYRNLAKIYFDKAKYQTAGQYYDSTLVKLTPRTREYVSIKKKRENLNDVIKYEGIAQKNDSILNVVALSTTDKIGFYQDYISKLKKIEEDRAKAEKLEKEKAERIKNANSDTDKSDPINDNSKFKALNNSRDIAGQPNFGPKNTDGNTFYFYNPSTVATGKLEFKKKWGNRPYQNNWRLSSDLVKVNADAADDPDKNDVASVSDKPLDPRYTTDFYIKQLPTSKKVIDSLGKERNFAYYQLGIIYKEKFKEYQLSANKLEQLLLNKPEERLVLPAMYNLFKVYEIINPDKAIAMKNRIIAEYPNSRYAQIIQNPNSKNQITADSPEGVYAALFKKYEANKLFEVLDEVTANIDQFTGDEIAPKFELLKANTIGKLQGLAAYKTAVNFVALNYPNVEEGKAAEKLLADNIPTMERLRFYDTKPNSWKILYQFKTADSLQTKPLIDKIKKFCSENKFAALKSSVDVYNMTQSFVVIHLLKDEEIAKGIASILKEFKEYKIQNTPIIISNENYKIVQIKKNIEEYLSTPKTEPVAQQPQQIVPQKQAQSAPTNQTITTPNTPQRSSRTPPNGNAVPSPEPDPTPTRELETPKQLPNINQNQSPKKP